MECLALISTVGCEPFWSITIILTNRILVTYQSLTVQTGGKQCIKGSLGASFHRIVIFLMATMGRNTFKMMPGTNIIMEILRLFGKNVDGAIP